MLREPGLRLFMLIGVLAGWGAGAVAAEEAAPSPKPPHVVFLVGEKENQSSQTIPKITEYLDLKRGMRCTLLMSTSPTDLPGLNALVSADLVVMYLRGRELPEDQMEKIKKYLAKDRPLVALRSSTEAFYDKKKPDQGWKDFASLYLGTPGWQFDYGGKSTTEVTVVPDMAKHPILKGVNPKFVSRCSLCQVLPLDPEAKPLLMGKAVGAVNRKERVDNPVAWILEKEGRKVFYTSLGNPDDFNQKSFRSMLLNAIDWALEKPQTEGIAQGKTE